MADDILKNIPLPADLPENWTSGQIIAPTGAEAGLDEQHGYNYLMRQVNNVQKALKALAAQREEDLAKVRYWVSDDPTSPASFIGGTWERIEGKFIMGASDTHPAGTMVEAGLPNITGRLAVRALKSKYETGVLLTQENGALKSIAIDSVEDFSNLIATEDARTVYGGSLAIDASRSNPIYGASDTVQPPAYCTYIWRRVA